MFWLHVNVVGSNAMARHASHAGFACAKAAAARAAAPWPMQCKDDGGFHRVAAARMMSLELGAMIHQSKFHHGLLLLLYFLNPELQLRRRDRCKPSIIPKLQIGRAHV